MIEHLIARGDIPDPWPFVRPFRRADLLAALDRADSLAAPATRRLIDRLRDRYTDLPDETRWEIAPAVGGEAYTHARRDPLHPAGPDGARPYAELAARAVLGNVVLATRPVLEPRLVVDPDWTGRKDIEVSGRMAEAYISAQFKWARLYYGQMDMNWGPSGLPGIPLSNYGYGRPALGFEIGTGKVRFQTLASDLRDETDSTGAVIHRYYFAHRLGAQLSRRVHLALWEVVVFAGQDRNYENRLRNPLSLSLLENAYGLGEETNSMLGADFSWQVSRRVTTQAQLALDDLTYKNRGSPTRNPDRWALTLMAFGPLGRRASWRSYYTQASSLAFRTFDNQFQDFEDGGVGIGRNFDDMDQLTATVSLPVRGRWLVTPELTVLRQGEGRLGAPYPASGSTQLGSTPQLFIGVVERTYRAALGLTGTLPHFRLTANAGYHRVENAGHIEGRTRNRFEGRLFVTVGFHRRGRLP
ncbi:MAG: hypothetical protein AB7Q69_03465 [Gemmatimonadales bacterium]